MSLRDLIRGPAPRTVDTDTLATIHTRESATVSSVSTLSVAASPNLWEARAAWDAGDLRGFYDERAAILEYDGGVPRAAAEMQAFEATVSEWLIRQPVPFTCSRSIAVAALKALGINAKPRASNDLEG